MVRAPDCKSGRHKSQVHLVPQWRGLIKTVLFLFFFLKKTHVDRYSDRADINYYNTKTGAVIRMGMLIGRRALNQMFDFHRLS